MSYAMNYYSRDGEPISVADWGRQRSGKRVARTTVGDIEVSTVWLGLDHGFGSVMLIFETMTFGGDLDGQDCWRYETEEEAVRGHLTIVDALRAVSDE